MSNNQKQVLAWGVRRKQVDVHQLALAYYLLARARIEASREPELEQGDPRDDQEVA